MGHILQLGFRKVFRLIQVDHVLGKVKRLVQRSYSALREKQNILYLSKHEFHKNVLLVGVLVIKYLRVLEQQQTLYAVLMEKKEELFYFYQMLMSGSGN